MLLHLQLTPKRCFRAISTSIQHTQHTRMSQLQFQPSLFRTILVGAFEEPITPQVNYPEVAHPLVPCMPTLRLTYNHSPYLPLPPHLKRPSRSSSWTGTARGRTGPQNANTTVTPIPTLTPIATHPLAVKITSRISFSVELLTFSYGHYSWSRQL